MHTLSFCFVVYWLFLVDSYYSKSITLGWYTGSGIIVWLCMPQLYQHQWSNLKGHEWSRPATKHSITRPALLFIEISSGHFGPFRGGVSLHMTTLVEFSPEFICHLSLYIGQHCGYWWPVAKAPGHQYPQYWPISKIIHILMLRLKNTKGSIRNFRLAF